MDTTFWLTALAILCLLVMSAFFSGSETALTASSRGKLKQLADNKKVVLMVGHIFVFNHGIVQCHLLVEMQHITL